MKNYLLTLATLVLLGFYAQAQKVEFEEFDLDNGLHVILHQDNTAPVVITSVMYDVGGKDGDRSRTGFAHFFEHLLFEGSENIGRGEFMKIIPANGGTFNANTSQDRTYYYEIFPSNKLELGLWMESERMLHPVIDQIGVDTQNEVVKEEKRQRVNAPYGGSRMNEVFEHAFVSHPYRWTPGGSPEYINQANLSEFMEFYKTFYVPNNACISIAGDISMSQSKEWIEKYFGTIPRGTSAVPRPTVVEPEKFAEVRDTVYDNIQLPAVVQAYHGPAQGTQDAYAVEMMSMILSQGNSSRLQKNVVDKQQKAVYAGAFPMPTEDPGLLLMFGIANMGTEVLALEDAMNVEVSRMSEELISIEEFEKLRNQIENDFISGNTSMAGIAESLSDYYLYYDGETNLVNTELERYFNVTREAILEVAKKYLRPSNRVTLHYLPKTEK
jgi:predicted Zn-dependent peptidase